MLTGVHLLLTYKCVYECDHCFLYCGPNSAGVFTLEQVKTALVQIREIKSVKSVYFEGGEPFLYYPLLVESLRLAKSMGYEVGVVTNAYWAISKADALIWLRPLTQIGVSDLSVSDDSFHTGDEENLLARFALEAARELGIPSDSICIDAPKVIRDEKKWQGEPVVGGDVLFRGRAADKLFDGLPRRHISLFKECPHEDLRNPGRVHLDPFGWVHLCQGLVIGNINQKPLKKIFDDFKPELHPIIGPLLKGGPAELGRIFNFAEGDGFIDHCHLCFEIRRSLMDKFPEYLAPKQVYGITAD